MAFTDRVASGLSAGPRAVSRNIHLAALAAVLVLAAATRFVGMGSDSLWRDEAVSWFQAHGSVVDVIAATARDNFPPLHNLLLAASMHLFGDSEWALRLPSALLGFANVLALYWTATLVAGRKAAVIAALLLAASPFHIWYSQEARNYTLLALSATLFVATAFWLIRSVTLPRVAAHFAAGAALLYSHPYGTLVWICVAATVLVALVVRPAEDGPAPTVWILLQAAIAIAFAPWAWVLVGRTHHIQRDGFWIHYPTPAYVGDQLVQLASGLPALVLLSLAALSAVVALPPRFAPRIAGPRLWIVTVWLASSLVVGVALSLVGTPIFIARYAIASLPPFLLLAAIGLARFADSRRGWAVVTAVIAAVCILAFMFGRPPRHEDWRSAAAYLAANLPADGCVLAPGGGHHLAFDYSSRGRIACVVDPVSGPVHLDNDVVAVVLTSEWSRRLLGAFDPRQWNADSPLEFSGVEVYLFRRVR